MKKIIGNIFVGVCVVLIIFMSILLLSYNKYRVSEFGNNTFLIIDNDMYQYKEGSLLIVNGKNKHDFVGGEYIFYYDTTSKSVKTVLSQVKSVYSEVMGVKSYELQDGYIVSEEDVIGSTKKTKELKGLGNVLSVLESKWGNLFLIVVPAFMLFIYEVINFLFEMKVYKKSTKAANRRIES